MATELTMWYGERVLRPGTLDEVLDVFLRFAAAAKAVETIRAVYFEKHLPEDIYKILVEKYK